MSAEVKIGDSLDGNSTEFDIPENIGAIFDDHMELLQMDDFGELARKLLTSAQAIPGLDMPFITQALQCAALAHQAQGRKMTGERYLVHPMRVAILSIKLAQELGEPVTDELIASAILHDTIEDSPEPDGTPLFTEQSLKETFFAGYDKSKKSAVAEDAEALNHNTVMVGKVVDSEKYYQKIYSQDRTTLIRRQIIKAADRIDNLLDPPTLPIKGGIIDGTDPRAALIRRKRPAYIDKTRDPGGIMLRLLPENTFLGSMVQLTADISQQTVTNKNFTPETWRQHVPKTAYTRFKK